MHTRPGTLKAVSINFLNPSGQQEPSSSGVLSAQTNISYVLLGWELTVPSGVIGVSFHDGAANVTGIRITTVDSPWIGGPMVPFIVGRPLKIKTDKPVNSLKGSIWYMEEERYREQTANLNVIKMAPRDS